MKQNNNGFGEWHDTFEDDPTTFPDKLIAEKERRADEQV